MTTSAPDPTIIEFLLDEEDLQLSAGYTNGYDPTNPICGFCEERETLGVVFGICAKGVTGRLCAECAARIGPLGEALADLVDGLETIASASADPDYRDQILNLAARALQWTQKAAENNRGLDGGDVTTNQPPNTCGNVSTSVSGLDQDGCGNVSTTVSAAEAGRD